MAHVNANWYMNWMAHLSDDFYDEREMAHNTIINWRYGLFVAMCAWICRQTYLRGSIVDDLLCGEVALVTDEQLINVLAGIAINFLQPLPYVVERFLLTFEVSLIQISIDANYCICMYSLKVDICLHNIYIYIYIYIYINIVLIWNDFLEQRNLHIVF